MKSRSVDSQISVMYYIELVEHMAQVKYGSFQEEELFLGADCRSVHTVIHLGCEGAACRGPIDAGSAPVHPYNYVRIGAKRYLQSTSLMDPVIYELLTELEPTPNIEGVIQIPINRGSCFYILRRKIKWGNPVIVVRHCLSSEGLD